jgi:hypothetical protein
MSDKTVNVLIKARDEASRKFGNIAKAALAMGGVFLGWHAIKAAVASTVGEFMKAEQASNGLAAALDLLGKKSQIDTMKDFASEIQKLTVIDDEAAMGLMQLGASMGNMSGDTLKQATVAAIGLSKAYGIDLEAAMKLVSKAAMGNTATMARYGITFKENMTDAEKFNQVLQVGQQKFAMAQAETQTFAGRLTQLKNAYGDLKEQIGQMITRIPGLDTAITATKTIFENFGLFMKILWTQTELDMISFWESLKFTFTDRIPAVFNWFKENWWNLLKDMANAAKQVVTSLAVNFMNFFKGLWSWAKGDGFNFEWTGLLEGFEATTAKFPDVISRAKTETEKKLANNLAENWAEFDKKLTENLTGSNKVSLTGQAALSAAGSAAAGKGVAAVESRFLTGQTTGQNYEKEIAGNNKKQTALLERLVKLAEKNGVTFTNTTEAFAPANLA